MRQLYLILAHKVWDFLRVRSELMRHYNASDHLLWVCGDPRGRAGSGPMGRYFQRFSCSSFLTRSKNCRVVFMHGLTFSILPFGPQVYLLLMSWGKHASFQLFWLPSNLTARLMSARKSRTCAEDPALRGVTVMRHVFDTQQ